MNTHDTPVRTLRLTVQGEPSLLIGTTSNYNWVWSDKGSGSDGDCTVWRPSPTDTQFFILGDYAQGNYSGATGSSIIVKAINDDPSAPLLKPASSWRQVWNDRGSGGDHDGSIWSAVAPDGYIAVGFVASAGYDAPSIPNYRCLRRDLVTQATAGDLVWSDKGSGAHQDVSLWAVQSMPNLFVAQNNYNPFTGTAYNIKGM
jgi:hypothetical protein